MSIIHVSFPYQRVIRIAGIILRKYCLSSNNNCRLYDVCVIGGGIIGTAIAREISRKHKTLKTVLIEKENSLGQHQSSHNSGVIHSGVYYHPDSLKAKFSRKGVDLISKYCEENKIPYKTFGKLVVASNASKLPDLRALYDRGLANKVEGLEMLWTREQIRRVEPKCNGIEAIWCPKAGNVDWRVVTESFGEDFRRNGGCVVFNNEVNAIEESDAPDYPVLIKTKQNRAYKSKHLILCGGVYSEALSTLVEPESKNTSTIMSLKVDYQLLKNHSIGTNIYGVPDLKMPFLGIHITPVLDGGLLLGPFAVPAFNNEGYRNNGINFNYVKSSVSNPIFQNMTKKYFFQCLNQVKNYLFPQYQMEELQSLADISPDQIETGPSAVQTQLINSDGSFVQDFTFEFSTGDGIGKRVINCKFLPSPAATCCLSIAEYVTENYRTM